MHSAPLAELFEFNFALQGFFLARIIIHPFADGTAESD